MLSAFANFSFVLNLTANIAIKKVGRHNIANHGIPDMNAAIAMNMVKKYRRITTSNPAANNFMIE